MLAGEKKVIAIAAAVLVIAAIGGGVAVATTGVGDDNEQPITGTALEQASEAALSQTGEGRVTETEVGDEESYYEVEVTLDDGSQVDVQLDKNFNVVGQSSDSDSAGDTDGPNDQ